MRLRIPHLFFLALSFSLPQSHLHAQDDRGPNGAPTASSRLATEEEVEQLRKEVAELKAIILRLSPGQSELNSGPSRLVPANVAMDSALPNAPASISNTLASPGPTGSSAWNITTQKNNGGDPPGVAGWTGEHFRLTSSDGEFTLMPVGYLNGQYSTYKGDGAPPDSFSITRARFGVQGTFGTQVDYAFLFESAAPITVRDAFLDFKPWG